MAHSADLDNLTISDLLSGIERRVSYLREVDTKNRLSAVTPVTLKGRDLPGVAESYALLTDLVEKIRNGEV